MADISNIEINDLLLKIKDSDARTLIEEIKNSGLVVPEWVSKINLSYGTLECDPANGIEELDIHNIVATNIWSDKVYVNKGRFDEIVIDDYNVPNMEIGNWTPILYNTSSNQISSVSAKTGLFYRVGKLVHVEAQIITSSNYACYKIEGLPFEPNHGRPSSVYPVGIYSPDASNSPINDIGGTASYAVRNSAYSSDITSSIWYVYGYYYIA